MTWPEATRRLFDSPHAPRKEGLPDEAQTQAAAHFQALCDPPCGNIARHVEATTPQRAGPAALHAAAVTA